MLGQHGQGIGLLQIEEKPLAVAVSNFSGGNPNQAKSSSIQQTTSTTAKNLPDSSKIQEGNVQLETVEIRSLPNPETMLLSQVDLGIRNLSSGQELLQLTPGLLIAQHAGGGKAEQMFFRGFDLDHGTDLSLRVDGVPVNQVSHAHGQGYSDLHFLIPETVNRSELTTGPSSVREGNFATAGALHFKTKDQLRHNLIKTQYGSFGTFRSVGLIGIPSGKESPIQGYFAGEFLGSRGYFEQPQDLRRMNLFGKMTWQIAPKAELKANVSWFQSKWKASGQVPERAVASGSISRFGAIDPTEGGQTARKLASLTLTNTLADRSKLNQQVYFVRNEFQLFSNFTFFLNNPIEGDRIRQTENRNLFGYQGDWEKRSEWKGIGLASTAGWGIRNDRVNDLELAWMRDRETMREQIQAGKVTEYNAFAYLEEKFYFTEEWKLSLGLRSDLFRFGYRDDLQGGLKQNSVGGRISPKLRLDWTPKSQIQFFAKAGLGFHSNDSRSAVLDPAEALPRATGIDAGVIWKPIPKLLIQGTAWGLQLQQELVYVGDEGIVEASGAARRLGVDISLRYQLAKGLVVSADLNYAHARYLDGNSSYVPLAPPLSSSGGLFGQISRRWSGSLGYRYLKDRPANEDGSLTAKGFMLANASAQFALTDFMVLGLNCDNLFNQEWNEAQFATTSQLAGETNAVEEIHFTPGAPRSFSSYLEIRF